jgi:hypothetical protein
MRTILGTASLAVMALAAFPASAQTAGQPWTVSGALEDSDAQGEEQRRQDDYPIRLEAGQRYRLSVNSEAFDPVARLLRVGVAEPVAENDDFEGLNSRINYAPTEGGDYVLRVTAFAAEGRGAYTASAEQLPPLPPPVSQPTSTETVTGSWSVYEGELSENDADKDGRPYDDYLVRFAPGQTRTISLHAQGFDPVVQVLPAADREGEPVDQDDDAGAGFNSLLGFMPETPGDYIVRVISFEGAGRGRYRLHVSN